MIQIIGGGGFATEIAAYLPYGVIQHYLSYDGKVPTNQHNEPLSKHPTYIAVGDPELKQKMYKAARQVIGREYFPMLNLGKAYGEISVWATPSCKVGQIICPGTIITVGVHLGDFVTINLNCTIGHQSAIGDYTTLSPGVNVSGNVTIGKRCYIGSNAVIREKIRICNDVTIGAGAVVVKDITEPGTYVGNPVRKL